MLSVIVNKSVCPGCSAIPDLYIPLPLFNSCLSCGCAYFIDKEKNVSKTEVKKIPIQPFSVVSVGTRGKYQRHVFQIIGHIRSISTDAISNEWLMQLVNGRLLWLVECGFSYFVFDSNPVLLPGDFISDKKVGSSIVIELKEYSIVELSKQVEFQAEGQFPEDCYTNEPYFKYEAVAAKTKEFVSICIFDKNTIEAYRGNPVTLASLELSSLERSKSWI
mgnify:CR=1 FL=1